MIRRWTNTLTFLQIDDYVFLTDKGGMIIQKNRGVVFGQGPYFTPLPEAEAEGISQSPDEIQLVDINGDGKADYVWTRKLDGRTLVWYNNYPNSPRWREGGNIAGGVGTAGSNIRWGKLTSTGRADYLAVEPYTGAVAAWLNGCIEKGEPRNGNDELRLALANVTSHSEPAGVD
jgi:hypothetical protein